MIFVYALAAVALAGCSPEAQQSPSVEAVARQVIPRVERAVGLRFRSPPVVAARSRAQVNSYLSRKLDQDLPPAELEQISTSYRLFGLIPDTLDLRSLLKALYSEQVVGYYDPDSSTLYVVEGAPPEQLRLVLAHELVHALQGQYVALDSMLEVRHQNDRRTAAQAVMEGQATLASIIALAAETDLDQIPQFWTRIRAEVRGQQERMPVFSAAPLLIREGLIFPYLAGADFVRWFGKQLPDTVPFGPRMPLSSEQILHPDRYLRGDYPLEVRFTRGPQPQYHDVLGEFETRILLTELTGSESVGAAGALGWGGDRYGVFTVRGDSTPALVWWTLWDTDQAAQRFSVLLSREWAARRTRPGRKQAVERLEVDGHPAVRLTDAPPSWVGWRTPPVVTTNELAPPGITAPGAKRRTSPRPTSPR